MLWACYSRWPDDYMQNQNSQRCRMDGQEIKYGTKIINNAFNLHRTKPKALHRRIMDLQGPMVFDEWTNLHLTLWICRDPYGVWWMNEPSPYVMDLQGPMVFDEWTNLHLTLWICRDPWCLMDERTFTLRYGSAGTHGVWWMNEPSHYVMGLQRPMVFDEWTDLHLTLWICRDPWCLMNERTFALRYGSAGTHGVWWMNEPSPYVMGLQGPVSFDEWTNLRLTLWVYWFPAV